MQKSMLSFKAFYFFIFAAVAFLAPFLTIYYEQLGLTGRQIGVLAAIPSLVTFFSAPIFGAISDITQRHKQILGVTIILAAGMVFLLSFLKSFLSLIPGVIFYAFFFAPALPLIDRSVIEVLGSRRDQYGKQRLWGAVGWGLLAPVSGYVVEVGGLKWAFYGAAILYLFLFLISQLTPVQQVRIQGGYWSGVKGLFLNRQVILFFGVMLVGGMGLATVHHYLFLYLSHLGARPVTMGSALTVATVSELLVMYFADRLLKSWKARGLILIGLGMLIFRLVGYAFAPSPQIALLFQLLHGPTFAAIWMAGVAYVAEIAPSGLGNTAQGLFTGVVMGLGSASGAFLGGFLYQSRGFSQMYLFASGLVCLALVIFWLASKKYPPKYAE
jgi:PPP family 3-phenylpropionic acid transporter